MRRHPFLHSNGNSGGLSSQAKTRLGGETADLTTPTATGTSALLSLSRLSGLYCIHKSEASK